MTRRKGDISPTRFCCYIYNGDSSTGPFYNGQRFGKAIAYKEFSQAGAALRWLNNPTRKLLPRQIVKRVMDEMSGCYVGHGGGQWSANVEAAFASGSHE